MRAYSEVFCVHTQSDAVVRIPRAWERHKITALSNQHRRPEEISLMSVESRGEDDGTNLVMADGGANLLTSEAVKSDD